MEPNRIEKLANRILLNLLYQKGLEEIRKTFPELDEGEFFLVYQMARMMAETISLLEEGRCAVSGECTSRCIGRTTPPLGVIWWGTRGR